MEEFWIHSARELATLISRMPDVDPVKLGEDTQNYLKAYKPTSVLWDERADALRESFVKMEPRIFNIVYETYKSEIRKHSPRLGAQISPPAPS